MLRLSRGLLQLVVPCVAMLLAGCGGKGLKPNQIFLMPAPDVYEEGQLDPFIDNDPISRGVQPGVLYATDRAPATADDRFEFYSDVRGNALRLGRARIEFGLDESLTWEEARRISLLKNRTEDYPLQVAGIDEFGVLERSITPFDAELERSPEPGARFSAAIDETLAHSPVKDVYIYVHGYKVEFENPLLVASELWHFLGYQGAFVAYSWPSTRRTLAYWSDLEDAVNSARGLRGLILHIAETTRVERIHVVGYSAGTRLVTRALADLGMYGYFMDPAEIDARVRLGNVILVGSDVDRGILGGYLIDGAIRIADALTIYQSSADAALGLSRFVFGKNRLGQVVEGGLERAGVAQYLEDHPELRIIDVSDAEAGTAGSGHSYFRESPWVSSDVLMTLLYDLPPEDRGLERVGGLHYWSFPEDYIARLRAALARVAPALAPGTGD